ncbi:HNH endonuclease signature motif containing protein [Burkholderia ubonensis]|uniref:HNH endonuclease signature motif containing protein n=1 Tax=Burkholderia ubonensis TaxID=101571 RepID=UPI0009B31394|nr:HNH endonuclease signature motif containing protein [Burkholderia ubonensis]
MGFSEEMVDKVWQKGEQVIVDGKVLVDWRKDQCGAWINRGKYGDRESDYGWEIDHISTKANGGGDELSNLRPLHWENNVAKSDGNLKCALTSSGNKNVKKT